MNFGGPESRVLRAELHPIRIHIMFKSKPQMAQDVTIFGVRLSQDVMKLK